MAESSTATTTGPRADVHLSGYQARDYEIVDYQMTELPGTGLMFRGPMPATLDQPGGYFAALGAAQTFGCFCDQAYPDLVSAHLGLPALNLGYGGAGPEFFASQEALLPYLNRAKFVIIQAMSARSQSNSYYTCDGLEYVTLTADGRRMGALAAFQELLAGPAALRNLPLPLRLRRKLANLAGRPRARAVVDEIRGNWVASMRTLIDKIEVPVVVLWFSKRTPAYTPEFSVYSKLFGEFPHMVTPEMIDAVRAMDVDYVECVSDRGSPQPLVSRFTGEPTVVETANDRPDLAGKPWAENLYYPSPEMQEDAAHALIQSGVLERLAAK